MLDFTDIPEQLRDMTSDYRINVIEIRKLKHTEVFRTDVCQVFDFIRCSENKKQLQELAEREVYYQHMEEDAFDVVAMYTNSVELIQAKDYKGKDGTVNMCTAIRELVEDSRKEGLEIGIKEGEVLFAD